VSHHWFTREGPAPCRPWSLANFQAVFGNLTGEVARPTLWRGRPRPRRTGSVPSHKSVSPYNKEKNGTAQTCPPTCPPKPLAKEEALARAEAVPSIKNEHRSGPRQKGG